VGRIDSDGAFIYLSGRGHVPSGSVALNAAVVKNETCHEWIVMFSSVDYVVFY